MPAQVTTYGTPEAGGYRHKCAVCNMDRIVPGERFKHICPASTQPNEPCPTCPEAPAAELLLPGLLTQAGNLVGAAARAAKQLISGKPILRSPADKAACLAICRGGDGRPPCNFYRRSDDRCAKCGCFVEEKSSLASEKCPRDLWPITNRQA